MNTFFTKYIWRYQERKIHTENVKIEDNIDDAIIDKERCE